MPLNIRPSKYCFLLQNDLHSYISVLSVGLCKQLSFISIMYVLNMLCLHECFFKHMRYIIVFDCYPSAVSYKGFRIILKK